MIIPISDDDVRVLESAAGRGYGRSVESRCGLVLSYARTGFFVAAARENGVSYPTAKLWVGRYLKSGIDGLRDLDRSGRPAVVTGKNVPGFWR
jgi:transposase